MEEISQRPGLHHIIETIAKSLDRKSWFNFISTGKVILIALAPKHFSECQKLVDEFSHHLSYQWIAFMEFANQHSQKWKLSFSIWKIMNLEEDWQETQQIAKTHGNLLMKYVILDFIVGLRNLYLVELVLEMGDLRVQLAHHRALDFSTINGHAEILQALLPYRTKYTSINDLICRAIFYNQQEVLKLLMTKTEDPSGENCNGESPLRIAIYRRNVEAVQLLGPFCKNPDQPIGNGPEDIPIYFVVEHGLVDVLKIYLSNKIETSVIQELICKAVYHCRQPDVLKLLIPFTKDPNKANSEGVYPIQIAASRCNVEAFKILAHYCADSDLNRDPEFQSTLVYFAVQHGLVELLNIFLTKKIDTKVIQISIEMAVSKGNVDVFTILAQHCVKTHFKDDSEFQSTIMYFAVEQGLVDTLENLLTKRMKNKMIKNSIQRAVSKGNVEVFTVMAKYCAKSYFQHNSEFISTFVYFAVRHGLVDALKAFLTKRMIKTVLRQSICKAIWHDQIEVLKFLILFTKNPNKENSWGISPIQIAITMGNNEAFTILVPYCENPYQKCGDDSEKTPMYFAVEHGLVDILKVFLTNKIEILVIQESIFKAVSYGQLEVLKLLLPFTKDPNGRNCNGVFPIQIAICKGNVEAFKVLAPYCKNPDLPCDPELKITPMHYAVEHELVDIVRLLLPNWKRPKAKTSKGQRALQIAKKKRNTEIMKLLQEHSEQITTQYKNRTYLLNHFNDQFSYIYLQNNSK